MGKTKLVFWVHLQPDFWSYWTWEYQGGDFVLEARERHSTQKKAENDLHRVMRRLGVSRDSYEVEQ